MKVNCAILFIRDHNSIYLLGELYRKGLDGKNCMHFFKFD
jgi:hypothetical protein